MYYPYRSWHTVLGFTCINPTISTDQLLYHETFGSEAEETAAFVQQMCDIAEDYPDRHVETDRMMIVDSTPGMIATTGA